MTSTAEPDLILLQRFKETGDADAFAEIVQRYAGAVFATCHRILRDPGAAEDAAQETFYRLMTRPQRVTASLGGWLHRAATHLALDIRRSEVSRHRRECAYPVEEAPEASNWADVAPKLDEALAALPDAYRDLLVRHFLRGESQADLAAERQTSAATLSRRMKEALEALRRELGNRGLCVAPSLLLTLLTQNGISSASSQLALTLGKMAMYCGARACGFSHGAAAAHAPASLSLKSVPRLVYSFRWGVAAAGFSLVMAVLVAMMFPRIDPIHPAPPAPDGHPLISMSMADHGSPRNR